MTARIGKRIREVLAISEKLGRPASYSEINAHMDCEPPNTYKYCDRATKRGLMVVDVSTKPAKYQAAANWRETVEKKKPVKQYMPSRIINSVFALGASA